MNQPDYSKATAGWWVADGQRIDRMGWWQFDEDGVTPTKKAPDGLMLPTEPDDDVFEQRGSARQIAAMAWLRRLADMADHSDPDQIEAMRRVVLGEADR
ncbi:hypothetical protein ABTX82_16785 [Streptomyces lavendulae]|uniref:hypothetical protein n=1 Tax=Streptomyces lavendulae TaxID=1914 RepID=UPI003322B727